MFNWAGNHEYGAEHVIELTSVSALAEELARTPKVRALGTRHSFNDIADGQVIVDTLVAREHLEINADRTEVTVNGSMTYGRLAELLEPLGFALHNLASLPHISIAGAISTGTHGSGVNNKNLAAAVTGIELATSSGEVGRLVRGDADFTGSVVGLGALGVMTKVSLEIEPAYEVAQFVYDDLPQEVFGANIDEIMGLGYSVSGFTTWGGSVEQLWVKHRLPLHVDMPATIFGATIASEDRHPIRGHAAGACTAQRGEAGLWSDRLPHFRIDFTPSAGDEIQSEFFVEWSHASDALDALHRIGEQIAGALLVSEIRAVAADDLWMSPHHGRKSLALHFTWGPDQAAAEAAAELVGDILAEFDARVHWGKVFAPHHVNLASFDRLDDYLHLIDRFDQRRAFRNDWFDRLFD